MSQTRQSKPCCHSNILVMYNKIICKLFRERNGISCSLSPDSILSPKQGDSAQQLISEHYFCVDSTSEVIICLEGSLHTIL